MVPIQNRPDGGGGGEANPKQGTSRTTTDLSKCQKICKKNLEKKIKEKLHEIFEKIKENL